MTRHVSSEISALGLPKGWFEFQENIIESIECSFVRKQDLDNRITRREKYWSDWFPDSEVTA